MPPIKYLGFRQCMEGGDEFDIIPTASGDMEVWRKSADGARTAIREPGQLIALLLAFVVGGVESNVPPEAREKAKQFMKP